MAGTVVVLGVGVAIASMVVPEDEKKIVPEAPASASTAARKESATHEKKKSRERRLSARLREERRRAVDQVRREGYAPVSLDDYVTGHVLRVIIGRPVGTTPKGLRAFFFVRGDYIGRDSTTPSLKLRPGRQLNREITLVYTLYEPGDDECCPKGGDTRVHFRWTGDALEPRETIPPDYQRMPTSFAQ
jgi:hypothetical protein